MLSLKNTEINYVIGDATEPMDEGPKIIVHCCNNLGAWGSGFVLALSRKWLDPEAYYRTWKEVFPHQKLPLGVTQFVKIHDDLYVANMIGQDGIGMDENGKPPIRYDAIDSCLYDVFDFAKKIGATIHGPRFGAGLAGGDWKEIEESLVDYSTAYEIPVVIYDLE